MSRCQAICCMGHEAGKQCPLNGPHEQTDHRGAPVSLCYAHHKAWNNVNRESLLTFRESHEARA